ncbi:MAG TPA: NAD(P)H-dependent oxidoreductase subunit E [Gammaproteobacteria bacterium]|nr:NAD(P)H-dependent oxidoreductase subunit E [Gammaproteobacteria bacterium]
MTAQQQKDGYQLSEQVRAEIDHWLTKYPPEQKRSAVLAALHAVQHQDGYVSVPAMDAVAAYLDMPPVSVYEVSSFYSMIETEPVARNTVAFCNNISCMLCGADELIEHVQKKLGIRLGESTPDGRIYLKNEEECLAACVGAPMMTVNGHYHEHLTIEKVDEILDGLE